ncbi:MAG: hypothetical protein K6F91_08650 [Ruminococcus sp.]|nr:hypothetical protein [Ruminococcus sp.]
MKRTAKTMIAAMAAITVMMSLASCGDTSESSSKSGTVSLVTTTTTAAPADSSSQEETTTTTTTAADSSEAETTTTTADSSEAETTTTTTEAPKEQTMADKLKITYNGVTFSVGDDYASLEKSLGGAADHIQAQHCTDDGMDDIYVYSGMDVYVFEGKVTEVMLYENGYNDVAAPETACGLKTGSQDATSLLGLEPVKASETDFKYDCSGLWVYVSNVDGKAYTVMIAENEKAIPEFAA